MFCFFGYGLFVMTSSYSSTQHVLWGLVGFVGCVVLIVDLWRRPERKAAYASYRHHRVQPKRRLKSLQNSIVHTLQPSECSCFSVKSRKSAAALGVSSVSRKYFSQSEYSDKKKIVGNMEDNEEDSSRTTPESGHSSWSGGSFQADGGQRMDKRDPSFHQSHYKTKELTSLSPAYYDDQLDFQT